MHWAPLACVPVQGIAKWESAEAAWVEVAAAETDDVQTQIVWEAPEKVALGNPEAARASAECCVADVVG